jgi:hypothetical protein
MPEGPSVTVTLRVASIVYYSGTGVLGNCVSLGTIVSGLADFSNLGSTFTRWTIRSARCIMMPTVGFLNALPSYRTALAIGYFND